MRQAKPQGRAPENPGPARRKAAVKKHIKKALAVEKILTPKI
jgi:hypothetical protein